MDHFIWMSTPIKNACWLTAMTNFPKTYLLSQGVPLAATFPDNVETSMDDDFKKATALTDDHKNSDRVKVCSPRLVKFLQERKVENVEYLPITIRNHKGKVASTEYCIVNPVGLVDALDLKASQPRYNSMNKDQIDGVEKLVLDPGRIDPKRKVFRLAGLYFPVLIAGDLADAIKAEGFVGPYFRPLVEFGH